ncbi:Crp/Fnr family transcriptional regulator [Caldimonas brevitalea]|uniref:Crp/Fnr family transcriptional regulator n=1 Tax=Caldimonas brevitalea TaxID=413882 RepID=UPI0006400735|nr:Crp/Fnr family transcriptional regulator [Caldimonas brevitalea]
MSTFPFELGVDPTRRTVPAGGVLFRQGSVSVGVFQLVSGRLRLMRSTPGGADVPMHTVRPGELFAEASLFSSHYHCDAVALDNCEARLYPKAAVLRHFADRPEALWAFTQELAHRLQNVRTRLEIKQIRSATERVLQYLRLMSDSKGVWQRPGPLKHLAEDIGLTHEALYRALAKLEREGWIHRSGAEIRLCPP